MSAATTARVRRGIVAGVRAETNPVQLVETLNRTFAEFRAAQDAQIAELRAGQADVVRTDQVERINAALGDMQRALDEHARTTAALRTTSPDPQAAHRSVTPEQAAYRTGFLAYLRRGRESAVLEAQAAASRRLRRGRRHQRSRWRRRRRRASRPAQGGGRLQGGRKDVGHHNRGVQRPRAVR